MSYDVDTFLDTLGDALAPEQLHVKVKLGSASGIFVLRRIF